MLGSSGVVTGLRISAGLAILSVVYGGIAPGFTSPGEPVSLIGGSALVTEPHPLSSPSGGLVWTMAALAQDAMPGPPTAGETVAAKGTVSPPTFSVIEIAPDGRIHFEGRGTPGTRVTLNRFDHPFASAVVTQRGEWSVSVEARIGSGEHVFSSMATSLDNGVPVAGSDVRIAIPKGFGKAEPGSDGSGDDTAVRSAGADRDAAAQRRRAEQLAHDASREFSEIEHRRMSQLPTGKGTPEAPALAEAEAPDAPAGGGLFFWLQEWLASSNREFQGKIIRRLQFPAPASGADVAATPPPSSQSDETETARPEAAAKAQSEAAARAEARRLAAERAAREAKEAERIAAERKLDDERRAAAAADARDAEAARQAEARRQPEMQREAQARRQAEERSQLDARLQAEAARKAEEVRRTAAEAAEQRRQEIAAQETRRQREAQEQAVAKAAEHERRLRDERERSLLAAEIEEKRRRAAATAEAEQRRRREAERQRIAANPAPARPPVSQTTAVAPTTEVKRSEPPPRRDLARSDLRGRDDASAVASEPPGEANPDNQVSLPGQPTSDGHVMPERWRRFAELYAASGQRDDRASGPSEAGRPGPRRTSMVKGDRRRAADDTCPDAGRRVTPPGKYVVRTGDSLWRISRRHYRKGASWPVIFHANEAAIDDPDLIFPCQRFEIPRLRSR